MIGMALLALVQTDALFSGEVLYENRLLYVPLSVNGSPDRLFLIDTGANVSAIDTGVAKELGIEPREKTTVEGTTGTVTFDATVVDELSLGDASRKKIRVTMQDFGGFLKPKGRGVAGILGSDFLKEFAVTVDYERRRITILRTARKRDRVDVEIAMEMDNGIPRVSGCLDQTHTVPLRIDTGASLFETKNVYINVLEKTWNELGVVETSSLTGTGTGGTVRLKVGRAASLSLGTLTVLQPYLIAQPPQGYFGRPDAVGFVSNNLLEKYSPVTFDFPGEKLVLTSR